MALLFSFSLAMNKFLIVRVLTANRLHVDPVFDQTRCRHNIDDAAELVIHGRTSLAALHNRGCAAPRECAIGLSYRFAEIRISVSHVATNSFERGSVRRTD